MKVSDLKKFLKQKDIKIDGKKELLISIILEHF